ASSEKMSCWHTPSRQTLCQPRTLWRAGINDLTAARIGAAIHRCDTTFEQSSPRCKAETRICWNGSLKNRTAGSRASFEVTDKGKPGESRRRKATRLQRITI